ncbi:MAG TPA: RHS repeat-associated core domain-containing protein [Rhodanobacteraceae bacterium]|nr:RHS repeat-associated core domain-containing protein [Rhodanobacteraceae bacterium]
MTTGGDTVYAATGVSYLPMDLGMTGWNSANGLGNSLGYDGDLRLTSINVPNVESLAFTYDEANRITAITNGVNSSYSQALGYDALGRLNSVTSGVQTASYGYDADGNRITQTLNGTATNFSYATSSNQLTATSGGMAASYGYDADGNTVSVNGSAAYQFGPFNRLVNASGASFVISAAGQRLAKSFGGSTTYFAPGGGGAMLAEDDAGNWVDYVWLNGRLVSLVKAGSVYSIHDDQTGRPVAITDANSTAVVWQAIGLPFDRQVTANTFGDFDIGFPGQYFDSEDGLYHNGARDYDAALGRYVESDPIGLAGGVNTYAYVDNNPMSLIDPLGLCPSHKCGNPPALPPGVSVKANIAQIQIDRAFAPNVVVPTLYNLVRNHGPWDYKQQNTYPGQYNAGGNFNYGATGAAAGLTSQALLRAAGAAQIIAGTSTPAWRGLLGPLGGAPYGDDPADQAAIKAGIAYYNCLASGGN